MLAFLTNRPYNCHCRIIFFYFFWRGSTSPAISLFKTSIGSVKNLAPHTGFENCSPQGRATTCKSIRTNGFQDRSLTTRTYGI